MAAELKIERSSHTENNSRREVELTKLLAAQDVSELTGLSIETLAQWRSQKQGPAIREDQS